MASADLGLLSSRRLAPGGGGDKLAEEGTHLGGQAQSPARGQTPKPQPRGPSASGSCRGQAANYHVRWTSAPAGLHVHPTRPVEVSSQPVRQQLDLPGPAFSGFILMAHVLVPSSQVDVPWRETDMMADGCASFVPPSRLCQALCNLQGGGQDRVGQPGWRPAQS